MNLHHETAGSPPPNCREHAKILRLLVDNRVVSLLVFGLFFCLAGYASAQPAKVDVGTLKAAGFQVSQSSHLTMVTDARAREDVQQFNEVFDEAVAQWCQYFEIPQRDAEDWHMTCFVIVDIEKFKRAGLIPDSLPPFPAGYQQDDQMWLFVKDGDYYTRHLLLHEGTHAFMQQFLNGFGPAWYAEGMAELLALHRWEDGVLILRHSIKSRDETPYWGRIKLIRSDCSTDRRMELNEVLEMPGASFRQVRAYGWAWATCEFFDSHPEFQKTFRKLPSLANKNPDEFNRQFREALKDDWATAVRQWRLMIDEAEYGYDVAKAATVDVQNRKSVGNKTEFKLAVDRGWQDTGIDVEVGAIVKITASGQFQIKRDEQPWPCQANGVTLQYYQGLPLGRLIGAIRTDDDLLPVIDVGDARQLKIERSGRLLLRVNESAAAWQDNQGSLDVSVESSDD